MNLTRQMIRHKIVKGSQRALLYGGVAFFVLICSFPLIEAFLSSLKPDEELLSRSSHVIKMFLPTSISLSHYKKLLFHTRFLVYYKNTIIVTVITVGLVIFISALAAYGLTRFKFLGRELYVRLILFTYMLPPILLFLPLHAILSQLGLTNSHAGLIYAYTSFCLPFSIWLLRAYFKGIPIALEEAAMIDGANRMTAFFRIVLPQAIPGMIAVSVFACVVCWNDYIYAMTLTTSDEMRTLSVGLAGFVTTYSIDWGTVMASVILATLPLLVLYIFVSKHLLKGFGGGGIKG